MKKNRIIFAIILLIITSTVLISQRKLAEPDVRCRMETIPLQGINIEVFHRYVTYLYKSGNLDIENSKTTEAAKMYIDSTLDTYKDKNSAVVFDLDETLLSNFDSFKKMNFSMDWEKVNYDSCTLIKPTFDLYKHVLDNNIKVILITARNEALRKNTVNNLKRLGITKWDTLMLMPKDMKWSDENTMYFKVNSRKAMTDAGYTIMFSIGDKITDLKGGFCDTTFKLVNVLY